MKLIINKYTNRIKLIKFFRSFYKNLPLKDAVCYADNLPYVFEDLSKNDIKEIQLEIKNFTLSSIEEDEENNANFCCYNSNINPPQEYLDALTWYESCSDKHKQYIDQIVLWKNRLAVC